MSIDGCGSCHSCCQMLCLAMAMGTWEGNLYCMLLTHWGRATKKCVGKLTIIGSDNGLSPGRRQAIIWTNVRILSLRTLGTNFSEILLECHSFSFKKMHMKMSSGKWLPSCLGLNVLTLAVPQYPAQSSATFKKSCMPFFSAVAADSLAMLGTTISIGILVMKNLCVLRACWCMGLAVHYNDIIMGAIASQITSLTIVYSIVYQRKHQSSASSAFVWGIHRGPVNSPHKWPVTRKMFPFDDVIMCSLNMDGSVPHCGNSSELAVELPQSPW